MELGVFLIILLGFIAGFCSTWLGTGGSIFIIPLLPFLSGLEPIEAMQISLKMIFALSLTTSVFFLIGRLILWTWFIRGLVCAVSFAFVSGFFVTSLSPFQIRFLLWLFLAFLLCLPWLLKIMVKLNDYGIYIFSSLMGVCSGLTGLGGGMILTPYLYESGKIPVKNIPALTASIMFFVSLFAFAGQISTGGFHFSSNLWFYFFLLLIPSLIGLALGYIANLRQTNIKWRRVAVRTLIVIMLAKLTGEMLSPFF